MRSHPRRMSWSRPTAANGWGAAGGGGAGALRPGVSRPSDLLQLQAHAGSARCQRDHPQLVGRLRAAAGAAEVCWCSRPTRSASGSTRRCQSARGCRTSRRRRCRSILNAIEASTAASRSRRAPEWRAAATARLSPPGRAARVACCCADCTWSRTCCSVCLAARASCASLAAPAAPLTAVSATPQPASAACTTANRSSLDARRCMRGS